MHPLKLIIPGEYWDSQIYRGKLYLFDRSGGLVALDWDRVVARFDLANRLKLPLMCAFQRSDYLYRVAATGILYDPEFRSVMTQRFVDLSGVQLELTKRDIQELQIARQDNPFPFPHADSTIYKHKLYVGSRTGVSVASCGTGTKYPISTKVTKVVDASALALRASYGTLALALGEDGLWEYEIEHYGDTKDGFRRVGTTSCIDCHWVFYSIYGSSRSGGGFLAAYQKESDYDAQREFVSVLSEEEVFGPADAQPARYSWGRQDKLCQSVNGTIRVAKYQPWLDEERIRPLGALTLGADEEVVAADIALYGTVVELPSRLIVIPSVGEIEQIDGEPVSWRIFVRSHHYENHLHVIYDDHICVFSFNGDYLVDQAKKISGVSTTHWYEAHGIGKKKMKIKRLLD